ncbi:hypothetical protein [Inhella proteolytica]|uniref:Uncharacterized protein n=1 Tax=Inhella proteolytica TaxID=2795029 RepID=A0A931J2T2_9BURK|nr:hypothetical protein [Inhella proteolytica]MBH9576688.1 hypothetical protein [Inhella proteolytica]
MTPSFSLFTQASAGKIHPPLWTLVLSCCAVAWIVGFPLGRQFGASILGLLIAALLGGALLALWSRPAAYLELPIAALMCSLSLWGLLGFPSAPGAQGWFAVLVMVTLFTLATHLGAFGCRRYGQAALRLLRFGFGQTALAVGLVLGTINSLFFAEPFWSSPLGAWIHMLRWEVHPLAFIIVIWWTAALVLGYTAGLSLPRPTATRGVALLALLCAALSLRSVEPWLRTDVVALTTGGQLPQAWVIAPAIALSIWLAGRLGVWVGTAREGRT